MKDNFSHASDKYQKFRPTYPIAVFDFIFSLISEKQYAWDCGTGNGQIAVELATHFKKVAATDISEAQIRNAVQANNIFYGVQPAEKTNFADRSFDLITVGQAIHWFDFGLFYSEVKRLLKPAGILVLIGYGLIQADEEINQMIRKLYVDIVGPYWDNERKYIDEHYQSIPFPFEEIPSPQIYNELKWSRDQFIGYLETWSAVKHFQQQHNQNPIELIKAELFQLWEKDEIKSIRFPILLRVGKHQNV